MNNLLLDSISQASSIVIAGHTRPDGDCIGSCMALYNYIKKNYENIQVDIYLEPIADTFKIIQNTDKIISSYDKDFSYDLFISLDCSDMERLEGAVKYFAGAGHTINIDHHISNTSFADQNHVVADSSSTCEVLYDLLETDKVDAAIAEAIYIGIMCDTGCFKHSNTSEKTMKTAGTLISKGVRFSKIIDEVFFQKTFMQNQLLGRCLIESLLVLDGKCIFSFVTKDILDFHHADSKDLEGVVDQLRVTKGVEAAILVTETGSREYKVSMRSNGLIDVNRIASYYGGGGHILASGCTINGSRHDIISNLSGHIEEQLNTHD